MVDRRAWLGEAIHENVRASLFRVEGRRRTAFTTVAIAQRSTRLGRYDSARLLIPL
jgi:hypothetical protein